MSMASRTQHIRPKAPRIVLFAIFCVGTVLSLTHCKMTPDKVTGVELQTEAARPSDGQKNRGNCVSDCAHTRNDARKAEDDLHKDLLDACGIDTACKDAENARHDAALAQIENDRVLCMQSCHHQGGGGGKGNR